MAEVSTIDQQILSIQDEISEKHKEIIELRKQRAKEEVKDYELTDKNGNKVMLSSLFGDKDELLVVHNMGKSCVYCTMWADGFRGITDMMNDRMSFVLISPDDHEKMKAFGENRHWNFNYVSANGCSFIKDLGFQQEKDGKTSYWPGASALIKEDGKIYRVSKDYFGPGDVYSSPWHFFNLFPKGSNDWSPKYIY